MVIELSVSVSVSFFVFVVATNAANNTFYYFDSAVV
jgi:hypothetical protein